MRLIAVLLVSLASLIAPAQTYFYVKALEVVPEFPTTEDDVYIHVFGELSSTGAHIVNHQIALLGEDVSLEMNCADPGGATVIVPHDTIIFLGSGLAAGTYTIELSGIVSRILQGESVEKEDIGRAESNILRESLMETARSEAERHPKQSSGKSGRKRKKKGKGEKKPKGETYRITYAMLETGKDIDGVAQERGLARSTIEGHVARGIGKAN